MLKYTYTILIVHDLEYTMLKYTYTSTIMIVHDLEYTIFKYTYTILVHSAQHILHCIAQSS